MGIEIVRVPHDFNHPTDEVGEVIPGAHHEPLYYADEATKTCFQIYENVSEGTPQSPVFTGMGELKSWLESQGWEQNRIAFLVEHGHAPSFVFRSQCH
jgi:hypothetical protein